MLFWVFWTNWMALWVALLVMVLICLNELRVIGNRMDRIEAMITRRP